MGVSHKDRCLNCLERVASQSGAGTAADGVVHNLATLFEISFLSWRVQTLLTWLYPIRTIWVSGHFWL